jgi:hypothetical protein
MQQARGRWEVDKKMRSQILKQRSCDDVVSLTTDTSVGMWTRLWIFTFNNTENMTSSTATVFSQIQLYLVNLDHNCEVHLLYTRSVRVPIIVNLTPKLDKALEASSITNGHLLHRQLVFRGMSPLSSLPTCKQPSYPFHCQTPKTPKQTNGLQVLNGVGECVQHFEVEHCNMF